MKACFQIAECSLSYAKIRTFSKRAYTWFSEDFTIIGEFIPFFHISFPRLPYHIVCACRLVAQ